MSFVDEIIKKNHDNEQKALIDKTEREYSLAKIRGTINKFNLVDNISDVLCSDENSLTFTEHGYTYTIVLDYNDKTNDMYIGSYDFPFSLKEKEYSDIYLKIKEAVESKFKIFKVKFATNLDDPSIYCIHVDQIDDTNYKSLKFAFILRLCESSVCLQSKYHCTIVCPCYYYRLLHISRTPLFKYRENSQELTLVCPKKFFSKNSNLVKSLEKTFVYQYTKNIVTYNYTSTQENEITYAKSKEKRQDCCNVM